MPSNHQSCGNRLDTTDLLPIRKRYTRVTDDDIRMRPKSDNQGDVKMRVP